MPSYDHHMTFEQHEATGQALLKARDAARAVRQHFPKTARIRHQSEKFDAALNEFRNVLDGAVFDEYPERETRELADVYYGPVKESS